MEDYILEMKNVTKTFPGVKALDDVTFRVKRGEIHALVGENGAGKSTLMKVLSGVHPYGSYTGDVIVNGKTANYATIRDSETDGVAIIYQELGLVGTLTVCENIFLGHEIVEKGKINWEKEKIRAAELLKEINLDLSPDTVVETLGTGKQQLIEIAKALNKNVSILILDEPTSSLTEVDSANLLELLRQLKKSGITGIYISHKLNEVMSISDTITVLRDGKTIATRPAADYTEATLIAEMVGRTMENSYPKAEKHNIGEVALRIKDWTVPNKKNREKLLLDHVNIDVRQGEIVGLAGLMGAGRTELAMSIIGLLGTEPTEGTLVLPDKEINGFKNPHAAIQEGVVYISEDRKRYGLVLSSDVKTNISLSSLRKISHLGVINGDLEVKRAKESVDDLRIKTPSIMQLVKNLSGGNQQKVVIAKALMTEPKVLILDEPTRGIDVGAKYEIYQLMQRLAYEGMAVIMISSELPEVIGMSDRIFVMSEGKISAELVAGVDEINQERILSYAAGGQ